MAEKKIPERSQIDRSDQWNLTPLFGSDDQWHALFKAVEEEIHGYDPYRGKLGESVELFLEALAFHFSVTRKLDRLYTYAHLKSDEDKSNQDYLGFHQQITGLYARAEEAASFIRPEILAIEEDVIRNFAIDKRCADYRFYIEQLLRAKPHTLGQTEEQLMAMTREMAQAPGLVFGQLDNVDLTFGSLTDEAGEARELSHGNFILFQANPDRSIRKKAFFQYYKAYDDHKHTLSTALACSAKNDVFYARARRFDNARQAALFEDNVPEAVYDNLVGTVKANLAPLFKYLDFRKKALGLEDLHFYDTYVPIVGDIDFHLPYEEAVATCVESLAPLGAEYTQTLEKGLAKGWVDRYENRGKRSGAYSSGCYDSPPYILMNYEAGNINSLYTLIHEAGHSMHSHYSRMGQSYVNHGYTIFVAEVASTFNEALLGAHLLEKYRDDPKMTAYVLNREIDNIRATLFRQTMFAEFETITHTLTEANKPVTLETFREIYRSLLEDYFGPHLAMDPVLELECLRIPHFYRAFYVYKYATGISAALALAGKVLEGDADAVAAYLDFLSLGGSQYPLDELAAAGVDMRTPAPIEAAIGHFDRTVKRLTEVYARL
ncbi:MAG: oligoendopeptidase F [Desulfobacterales bacterium]|nr:oligoendopeptidase F [Desulfobacterales bacterium]